jgi:CBS domain-containing protein
MNRRLADAELLDTAAPQSTAGLSVADVMSKALFTVAVDETVTLAWELLRRSGYHHLPVVDDAGRCAGLLRATELAAASGHAWPLEPMTVQDLLKGWATPSVRVTETVQGAAKIMARFHIDGLPVVDEDGLLVGLITAWDLVECLAGQRRLNVEGSTRPTVFRIEPVLP